MPSQLLRLTTFNAILRINMSGSLTELRLACDDIGLGWHTPELMVDTSICGSRLRLKISNVVVALQDGNMQQEAGQMRRRVAAD